MTSEEIEVIGGEKNFWIYSESQGYDITHPPTPTSTPVYPRIPLETTKGRAVIDPKKTALVVIDLQNYFLSPALGRPTDSVGMKVVDQLLEHVIPACRKAGIPIVWLGWGLTDEEIDEMPPTIVKGFGVDNNFVGSRWVGKLGSDLGQLKLDDGREIDGGRVLIRDQWSSQFYQPLKDTSQEGDMVIYKNRLSGFWGGTGIEHVLKKRGIKTLLFAGANTDQCVGGSLQDAFTKGWDCLMLSDACATTSPVFAKQCIEFNCEEGWGFVLTSKAFAEGVEKIEKGPPSGGAKSWFSPWPKP